MTEHRYMDVATFRAEGYLQELNRRLLHPLGLALEIEVLPDGTERLGGIQDHRDDPVGVYYGPGVLDPEKAERISAEQIRRHPVRMRRLGYVGQPIHETATEEWHIHTDETAPASDATAAGATTEIGARP